MPTFRSLLLAAGLALLAAVPASASLTALPTVDRTLTASRSSASCAAAGTSSTTYTAPMAGFVTARLDAAGGQWDLYMADARAHRSLSQSRAFGSHEVTQAWVSPGQKIVLTGCRTAGSVSRALVTIQLVDAPKPAAAVSSLVRTKPLSHALMDRLTPLGFDFSESQYSDHTDIFVPSADKLAMLRKLGVKFQIRQANLEAYDRRAQAADAARAATGTRSVLPSGRSDYRFLSDYQSEMQAIVKNHPDIARPVTIGQTYEGRDIQGVELSDNVNAKDDGKPVYFVMGVHHAREWPAGEIAMEFMTLLANEYGQSDTDGVHITNLLQHERILIVPIINEDGFYASRGDSAARTTVGAIPDPEDQSGLDGTAEPIVGGGILAYRRKNCDSADQALPSQAYAVLQNFPCYYELGVDPNRNYGFDWGGPGASNDPTTQVYRGTGQWSEPETQAVWHYSQTHPVTAMITLHTVAALVLRSPGLHTHGKAPDENLLKELGDKMAKVTGYTSEYGWQLYDTTGTTEDWNYGAAGTLGYTIEIGDGTAGLFHDVYQNGVIDQWTGKKGTKFLGGMHTALLTAADYAAAPNTHSILTGTGPAGATLEVKKTFVTDSSQICTVAQGLVTVQGNGTPVDCAAPGAVFGQTHADDLLDYKTQIPAGGAFTWHITQSTRPFVGGTYDDTAKQQVPTGKTESWTLTCSVGGTVTKTQSVTIARGQQLDLGDVCS